MLLHLTPRVLTTVVESGPGSILGPAAAGGAIMGGAAALSAHDVDPTGVRTREAIRSGGVTALSAALIVGACEPLARSGNGATHLGGVIVGVSALLIGTIATAGTAAALGVSLVRDRVPKEMGPYLRTT